MLGCMSKYPLAELWRVCGSSSAFTPCKHCEFYLTHQSQQRSFLCPGKSRPFLPGRNERARLSIYHQGMPDLIGEKEGHCIRESRFRPNGSKSRIQSSAGGVAFRTSLPGIACSKFKNQEYEGSRLQPELVPVFAKQVECIQNF